MLQQFVDTELKRIVSSAEKPSELEKIRELFNEYLEFRVHGFEFISQISNFLRNYYGSDRDSVKDALGDVALKVNKIGKETGERYDITDLITPQELALVQSSEGEEGISDKINPYKPYILRENPDIGIGNLNKQRSKVGHKKVNAFYFGLGESFVNISLELLDQEGNAIGDPRPLDAQLKPIQPYTKSPNFPFRRD